TLMPAWDQTVTVHYATAAGTATDQPPSPDFVAQSGNLTFPPGTTSLTVSVPVIGDKHAEPSKGFFLNLSAPVNAQLGDSQGQATIQENALPATLQFGSPRYTASENGATATLAVIRTGELGIAATVQYQTVHGSAIGASDYGTRSGTLSFGIGVTTQT